MSDYEELRLARELELARLRKAEADRAGERTEEARRYGCEDCAIKDAEIERLHSKLQRVADWLRHEANSPGGLAAEIECVLKGGEG